LNLAIEKPHVTHEAGCSLALTDDFLENSDDFAAREGQSDGLSYESTSELSA